MEQGDIESLKKQAALSGQSITEHVLYSVKHSQEKHIMQAKIDDLQSRLTYLENQGKKVPTHKRISIPVTYQEWELINRQAHKAQLPKSQFLRAQLFQAKPERPALE